MSPPTHQVFALHKVCFPRKTFEREASSDPAGRSMNRLGNHAACGHANRVACISSLFTGLLERMIISGSFKILAALR